MVPELRKQIENSRWRRPTQDPEAAKVPCPIIGHEQDVGSNIEGKIPWIPEAQFDAAVNLIGDHADRDGTLACLGDVLEIEQPDLPEIFKGRHSERMFTPDRGVFELRDGSRFQLVGL